MARLATRAGLVGAMLSAAALMTTVAAGTASATQVSGGWYSTLTQCTRAGGNAVNSGGYSDFQCNYSATHSPHYHLVLFT